MVVMDSGQGQIVEQKRARYSEQGCVQLFVESVDRVNFKCILPQDFSCLLSL